MAANNIEGKKICKLFVQRGLGLTPEAENSTKVPLVICITRLVAQKGLHLITNAIRHVETHVSPPKDSVTCNLNVFDATF